MKTMEIHCDDTLFIREGDKETEVSVYRAAELRLHGLHVVKTFTSPYPNRSAIRCIAAMPGVVVEIRVHCHLMGRNRHAQLS